MRAPKVLALAAVLSAGAAAPAAQAAPPSPALTAADAPGLVGVPIGPAKARRQLGARVPLQAAALRGRGANLLTGVASYRTTALATRAVSRRPGVRLAAGDGARLAVRRVGRRQVASGAVRVGDTVGFLRLESTRTASAAAADARSYLQLLGARILRLRGRPGEERILLGLRPDGTAPPDLALKEFALMYGALPGVPRPAGAASGYGTTAIALALANRAAFTPEQQQAIDAKLATGPIVGRRSARPRQAGGGPPLTPSPTFQALVDPIAAIYSAKLGRQLPFPVKVFTTPASGGAAWADAYPVDAAGEYSPERPAYCRVRIYPLGQAARGALQRHVIAHELFHCFEFLLQPNFASLAAWRIEGLADWAAYSALSPTSAGLGGQTSLSGYFGSPTKNLFSRAYDASGFFGAIDSYVPGGMWSRVPGLLAATNNVDAFAATGGTDSTLMTGIASGMFRDVSLGGFWAQPLPFLYRNPGGDVPAQPIASDQTLVAPAYTSGVYIVRPQAPALVHLSTILGYLHAATRTELGNGDGQWFCAGKCECPKGLESSIPPNVPIGPGVKLGLNGGGGEGRATVEVHKIEEFCKKKKPQAPTGSRTGRGRSNGDPHLTTLDGLYYDFQAAGEFTLVRSDSGDLEIQARQQQLKPRSLVTIDTMIGMLVDGHRVVMEPGDGIPTLRVDDVPVAVPTSGRLAVGGGSVSRDDKSLVVTWPDGSAAEVHAIGGFGLAISLELAAGRARHVSGLFGNFDGSMANDLVTRTGRPIAYTLDTYLDEPAEEHTDAFFRTLYKTFGESWRITQAASLLHYEPGQTTATFTDRSVPAKRVSIEDLPADQRAAGAQTCRAAGVTVQPDLDECTLDIALTGRSAFAEAAAVGQRLALGAWTRLTGTTGVDAPPRAVRTPDGTAHITFAERRPDDTRRYADLRLDGGSAEQPPVTVAEGDASGAPAVAPDGSLTAFLAGVRDGAAPPSGIYRAQSSTPWASWAPGPAAVDFQDAFASEPDAAFLPDGTALVASGLNGPGRLFRVGAAGPDSAGAPLDADGCTANDPGVTVDGTGAPTVAWRRTGCGAPGGVVVSAVDAATGQLSGPAQLAPGSGAFDPGDHVAVAAPAGRPGAVVAYGAQTGPSTWEVRLWRAGDPAPVTVGREQAQPAQIRLSAEPRSGRLWVAWQAADDQLRIVPTKPGALAADGTPSSIAPPTVPLGGSRALALVAGDGEATAIYARYAGHDDADTLWRLRVRP